MPTQPSLPGPKYRHYRPKNLAVVRLNGRDFYLGEYNSPESHERYFRLIAEWLANGRQMPSVANGNGQPVAVAFSINEMLLAYWRYAENYYQTSDGRSKELTCMKHAIKPLKELYGKTAACDFGPKALKLVRQRMIDCDICRKQINSRINRIRRIFKWAASEELVPPSIVEGLRTVAGLEKGHTSARESKPVKPVAREHVEAILPFVSPHVSAMIQLQLLTGMRPCEVTIMKPCSIDCSGDVWNYTPTRHKTDYLGHEKVVPLGPKAQDVIRSFLDRPSNAYCFSPREAEEWRNANRAVYRKINRKTKIYPCELRARERRKAKCKRHTSKRPKRERFDTDSYRRAITYGIVKARKAGVEVPDWHPHQLRHTRGTEVRKQYGLEGAQVALGHQTANVTQVYAERDQALAIRIARESG